MNSKNNYKLQYLFIPRKAQITISLLLIFTIVFSLFGFGIYLSREMISSVDFRNAVDAAAFTAGSDLSKAINLYITIVGIRLVIFGVSVVLFIVSLFVPQVFNICRDIINKLRDAGHSLEYASRYIPVLYTGIAIVDTVTAFNKNLLLNGESTSDAHIIVIPTALIEKLLDTKVDLTSKNLFPIETNYDKTPSAEDVASTFEFLTKGFTIFAYRKRTTIEKLEEKISKALNETNKNKPNFLDDTDFLLIETYPIRRSNTGVSLGDAINISNVLVNIENGFLRESQDEETKATKQEVKEIQCKYYYGGLNTFLENLKNGNYLNSLNLQVSDSNKDNIIKRINELEQQAIECAKSYVSCDCNGKTFNFESLRNKIKSVFSDLKNNVTELISNYNTLNSSLGNIQSVFCGQNENNSIDFTVPPCRDSLKKMVSICDSAISKLNSLNNSMKTSYYAHKWITVEYPCGPNGELTCSKQVCINECKIDFSEVKSTINGIISNLKKIRNEASKTITKFDQGSTETKNTVSDHVKKMLNDITNEVKSFAGSFSGFPGGNILSYIFNSKSYKCNCEDSNIKNLQSFGELGNFVCAVNTDLDLIKKIVDGGKFDFISYYSPVFDEPEWLKSYKAVEINTTSSETIKTGLTNIIKSEIENLKNQITGHNTQTSVGEVVTNFAINLVSGFIFGGPVGLLANAIISTLAQVAEELLIKKVLRTFFEFIKDKVDYVINSDSFKEISKALEYFIDNINAILSLPLRLLGTEANKKYFAGRFEVLNLLSKILNDRLTYEDKVRLEALN